MRRHLLAVSAGLLFLASGAEGRKGLLCPDKRMLELNEECVRKYWARVHPVSPGWLDTMDTWTAAADWREGEDCSKVRSAAHQVIVFEKQAPG